MVETNNLTTDTALPITYTGWDEAGGDYGDIQFYNVTFLEDFGPIKKNDKFDSLVLLHSEAKLLTYVKTNPENDNVSGIKEIHNIDIKICPK